MVEPYSEIPRQSKRNEMPMLQGEWSLKVYAKQKKAGTEDYILHGFICMTCLELTNLLRQLSIWVFS